MGRKIKDLTNERFGKLIAIEFVGYDKRRNALWRCRCDCGNEIIAPCKKLNEGMKKSCGCLGNGIHPRTSKIKRNGIYARLHRIWSGMKRRCYSKNTINYASYGGKDITLCEEWRHNFTSFCEWAMANGYNDSLSIDRIDSNGNYCPENCQWATRQEQSANRKSVVLIEYNGEKMTSADWSKKIGGNSGLVGRRLKIGWSIERAITTPPDKLRIAKDKR
jgi:hypothetical protein